MEVLHLKRPDAEDEARNKAFFPFFFLDVWICECVKKGNTGSRFIINEEPRHRALKFSSVLTKLKARERPRGTKVLSLSVCMCV